MFGSSVECLVVVIAVDAHADFCGGPVRGCPDRQAPRGSSHHLGRAL